MDEPLSLLNEAMWYMQRAKRILKYQGEYISSEFVNDVQDQLDDLIQEMYQKQLNAEGK